MQQGALERSFLVQGLAETLDVEAQPLHRTKPCVAGVRHPMGAAACLGLDKTVFAQVLEVGRGFGPSKIAAA